MVLVHPNGNIYKILLVLETTFQNNASCPDVFENTLQFLTNQPLNLNVIHV